jgi:hypothetical protein
MVVNDNYRGLRRGKGGRIIVLFGAYDLGPTVVQARRAQRFPFTSTLKSPLRFMKPPHRFFQLTGEALIGMISSGLKTSP